jgi:organic radical activating enzyme
MNKLKISEIFYSLQGEGARIGTPTIFVRTTGCKAKNACYALGIKCDTEFESGKEMNLEEIEDWIIKNGKGCKEITWTGGEPLDQLTNEITLYFKNKGYFQAIETSGLHACVENIDFICVSPKVAEHVILKNFDDLNWSKTKSITKITIYRILQELLVNMKKHSQSTIVVIGFETKKKTSEINYSDNGIGTAKMLKLKNGLKNMEYRIKNINGIITFESEFQKGFRVKIIFPK